LEKHRRAVSRGPSWGQKLGTQAVQEHRTRREMNTKALELRENKNMEQWPLQQEHENRRIDKGRTRTEIK